MNPRRTPPRGQTFLAALRDLRDALSEVGTGFFMIGGVAVIAHGVARHTADIDAVVLAEGLDLRVALRVLARHGIAARVDDPEAFARENQVILLEHSASGIPLDVSIGWLPFETSALAAAVEVNYGSVRILVPCVTDLIVYKLLASRPRDLDDAQNLVVLHGSEVDFVRAHDAMAPLCAALEDPGPLETLGTLRKLHVGGHPARKRAPARPKASPAPRSPKKR